MRLISAFLLVLTTGSVTLAQWNTSNSPKIYYNSGNVGIGLTNPSLALSLYGDENQTTLGNNTLSAFRLMNGYATAFGRRSEIQFGLSESSNTTLAVVAAEYTNYGSDVGGDLVFGT